MSASRSPTPTNNQNQSSTINRQLTTPFLLNFCYRVSAFHSLTDFPLPTPSNPKPPLPSHLQIYTWYSCTLKELAHLLTSALPNILPDPIVGTRLSFRLVYPDTSSSGGGPGGGAAGALKSGRLGGEDGRGRYVTKEMGSVVVSAPTSSGYSNGKHNEDDMDVATKGPGFELGGDDADKTLADARFVIGDYIDCAVFPPLSDGSVVPRSSISGGAGGSGMGSRSGGFRENGHGRLRGAGFGSSRGGGGGGYGSSRGDFGAGAGSGTIPSGEWRRGERLPESGHRGASYGGRPARRAPY